jgi:L-ascorbate metabolism protein UlaG (beta-lactamase superfamily)
VIEPMQSDDVLLADIERQSRNVDLDFDLWWLGQSGFLLQFGRRLRILIDPYLSDSLTSKYAATATPHVRISRRVIDPALLPLVDIVTSSHNHTDHLDAETLLPVFRKSGAAVIVVPEANRAFAANRLAVNLERLKGIDDGEVVRAGGVEIMAVASAHPTLDRDEHGRCKYLGYVFRFGGWSIYHSGDTLAYDGLVARLRPFNIDIAILPINGKLGNMDAAAAARLAYDMNARLAIPCHYNLFEFNTAPPAAFEHAARALGLRTRILQIGERFNSAELRRP